MNYVSESRAQQVWLKLNQQLSHRVSQQVAYQIRNQVWEQDQVGVRRVYKQVRQVEFPIRRQVEHQVWSLVMQQVDDALQQVDDELRNDYLRQ